MLIIKENAQNRNRTSDTRIFSPLLYQLSYLGIHHIRYCQCKLRGQDLNLRPSGYEPDELPDCSTPRYYVVYDMFSFSKIFLKKKMDGGGFEPPKQIAADLQSVPFGHSGICPFKTFNMKLTHFNSQNKLRKADDRTRTDNLLITNQLLCQLSHIGVSNGTYRARTYDPLLVRQMLSQLS